MYALGYIGENGGSQTAEVALNMRYLVAVLYLISAVFQFIGLGLIYNLDKRRLNKMNSELAARNANNASTNDDSANDEVANSEVAVADSGSPDESK